MTTAHGLPLHRLAVRAPKYDNSAPQCAVVRVSYDSTAAFLTQHFACILPLLAYYTPAPFLILLRNHHVLNRHGI